MEHYRFSKRRPVIGTTSAPVLPTTVKYPPLRRAFVVISLLAGCTAQPDVAEMERMDLPSVHVEDYVVQRGDVFATAVENLSGVPDEIRGKFVQLLSDSVRILKVGDTLRAITIDGKLVRLELRRRSTVYEYDLRDERFVERKKFRTLTPRYAEVEVKSTLWDAFMEKGLPPILLVNLVNVFSWEVDFATETQKGDSLRVLYAPDGTVYYAEYVGKSVGRHVVARFMGSYYDEKGNSVRRTFLKSPLRSYRITSGFGVRFHPILKKWRPHHGIDYAAPYGTPVHAVAGGKVIFAGWRGGYGKAVVIKHKNGYQTLYGHLGKILVRVGQHVDQGQTIGLVGSTGLSTGPHLHFEVRHYGRRINPALIKSEPEKPLPEDLKDDFYRMLDEYRRLMNSPEVVLR